MNGLITLVGSGEYLPVMEGVDRHLLGTLNGKTPRVVCLPTAAGQEGDESVGRWSRMGVEHFTKLGAEVTALPIIDKASADDEDYASTLENADFIYFSGGNPTYLHDTMHGSRAWSALQKAWARGAIYAGCSAGAMILAEHIPSFRIFGTAEGFGVIPVKFIVPHFDAIPLMFKPLVAMLKSQLKPGDRMLGIDENTALVGRLGSEWQVMGHSQVHLFAHTEQQTYEPGQRFVL